MHEYHMTGGRQGLQRRKGGAWYAVQQCYLFFDKLNAQQRAFVESVATRSDAELTVAEVRMLSACLQTAWGRRAPDTAA